MSRRIQHWEKYEKLKKENINLKRELNTKKLKMFIITYIFSNEIAEISLVPSNQKQNIHLFPQRCLKLEKAHTSTNEIQGAIPIQSGPYSLL